MPHGGVPSGITSCLFREYLQASAGVNEGKINRQKSRICYTLLFFNRDILLTYDTQMFTGYSRNPS